MKLDLTFDNKYMVATSNYPFELMVVRRELTRELSDAWIIRNVLPTANTLRCFMNEYGMIPVGLWLEVIKIAKKYNIYLEFSQTLQTYLNTFQLNYEQFKAYVDRTFNGALIPDRKTPGKFVPFVPREYQIKAAYALIKYRFSTGEISTSAGKTLISFIIFKYLVDCCYTKKILYIVPSVDLATLSAQRYEEYESYLKLHNHNWEIGILKAGLKKKEKEAVESCNILFGTFQSLCKRPIEFFDSFTAIIVDECCHPDTIITMADGEYKKIKDVNIGDKVITYNEITKQKEIKEVEYVYKNLSKNQQMYEIEREDGKILRLTGNHKVYTSRGYIRVDELLETDELLDINETIIRIKSIKRIDYTGDVYNLRIKSDTDTNHNYFANLTCISNCHHLGSSPSMKNIMNKCVNTLFAIGVTGTFPKHESYENLTIQTYVGPMVYTLTADELINEEKSATPIYAIFQIMDWCPIEEKKALYIMRHAKSQNKNDFKLGNKLMKQETKFINNSYARLKYIGDMAIKMAKNTLILFGDVKGGYGRKLHEYIKDNSDKDVYYVDGETPNDIRDYYKLKCELDTDGKTVLVASIGTFGEGIDLSNIWSIFLVNSAKSERLVRQICGRGLRQYPGKDKTLLFDFVDDLRYTMDGRYEDNYMWKHYKERKKIYKEQRFPTYEQTISFDK